ncbi:MAG: hypothetical protein OEY89_06765 [Gammaproteobacteria bacterium]|nr:hypothetical protein [Gammaproteobacteria bacterium]
MAVKNEHSSLKKNTGSTLVSMALDKAGSRLGPLISPALWVHDYIKHDKQPDIGDYSIYIGGLLSGPAAIITGLFKSVVEDEIETKLNHVRSIEPALYRNWIKPCYGYNSSAPRINAMTLASSGTTVWHHPIGIWVYITDADGNAVIDYKPVNPTVVYRPRLPLEKSKTGGYIWTSYRY